MGRSMLQRWQMMSWHAGTTTTCESLFMGVPVVTLAGHCHAHNVGKSLLHAIGIADEWACMTREEYVACAVRWASDHVKLGQLRKTLRGTMLESPLCEPGSFMKVLSLPPQEICNQDNTSPWFLRRLLPYFQFSAL